MLSVSLRYLFPNSQVTDPPIYSLCLSYSFALSLIRTEHNLALARANTGLFCKVCVCLLCLHHSRHAGRILPIVSEERSMWGFFSDFCLSIGVGVSN